MLIYLNYFINLLNILVINNKILSFKKLEHDFPKKVLKSCNEIVKFFNKSHQGKALLVKCAKNFNIEGGGLKTWVETRWTTMFDAADSVLRLKLALEKVIIKKY